MIWFLIAVIGFAVVYFFTPRKQIWIPFALLLIAFTVIAYHAVPAVSDDLFRYHNIIDSLRWGGYDRLREMIENNEYDYGALPVCGYYFYFISLLPNNNYLSAITMFIVYACMFHLLLKVANRYDVGKLYLFVAAFFAISTYWYYDTCSGIRNGLAFAVAVVCIYYHFVEHKHILLCFVGYVLVCGLHSSGIVLVALAFIAWISWKNASKFINAMLIVGLAVSGAALSVLSEMTDNHFIQTLAGKTEKAADGNFSLATNVMVNYVTFFIAVMIILYSFYYIKRYVSEKGDKTFFRFVEVLAFFMVGCLYSGLIFVRLTRWVIPVVAGITFMVGMQIQADKINSGEISADIRSGTAKGALFRMQSKGIFSLMIFVYSVVHLWYDCTGSSLIWLHCR